MADTSECGLDVALAVVGGKWKPLIIFHLQNGERRFGELRRLVAGISEKVLIQQLRELEAHGILTRTDHHEVPPRVDYALTGFGGSLVASLMPLCGWGNENRVRIERMLADGNDLRSAAPAERRPLQ
jgi:DNA-binding HxlR family transcriptional regulator